MTGWMLFLFIALGISLLAIIGSAIATYVRVRKGVSSQKGPPPDDAGKNGKNFADGLFEFMYYLGVIVFVIIVLVRFIKWIWNG